MSFLRIVFLLACGALLIAGLSQYQDRIAERDEARQAHEEAESDAALFSKQLGQCQAQLPR